MARGRPAAEPELRGSPASVTGPDTNGAGSFMTRPQSIARPESVRYLIFSIFFEIDIEPNRTLQK